MWLSKTKILNFAVGFIVISFLQYSYFNYRVGNEHRTLSEAVDILTFKFSETIAYEDLYEESILKIKQKKINELIESEQKSWEEGREERLEHKVDELLVRIDNLEKEQSHEGE